MSQEARDRVNASLRVFAFKAEELRAIVLAHVASAQECAAQLLAEMPEEKASDDVMAVGAGFQSQRDVFQAALRSVETIITESVYLADHVAEGEHRLTAAEILAFRSAFGPLKIDRDKLRFAPAAASPADAQAERRQSELMIAKPRIVLPPGVRF